MIKCHNCLRELKFSTNGDGYADLVQSSKEVTLECPEGHSRVAINSNGEIVQYLLFWDEDVDANTRYQLIGGLSGTLLLCSTKYRQSTIRKKAVIVFRSPIQIPIAVKDNVLQLNNLIFRLKRMGAFA